MALKLIPLAAAAACSAALAAGCGGDDPTETPPACKTDSSEYIRILAQAPEGVAFDDGTTISECLPAEQTGGDLATVGQQMIAAATDLNAQARENPTGQAAVQLGYLVGAVEKGAEGIHMDLQRRLNSAARYEPDGGLLPPEFERTFGQGYSAGKDTG